MPGVFRIALAGFGQALEVRAATVVRVMELDVNVLQPHSLQMS
jgi:hypothetical protein